MTNSTIHTNSTYRVMMTSDVSLKARVSIIVASSESQAMQFAELQPHNKGYRAQFALEIAKGSIAD